MYKHNAPIGASMVHLLSAPTGVEQPSSVPTLKSKFKPSESGTACHDDITSLPGIPCLLLPNSRLAQQSKRILLQGPSKSGRTSLAMNLAYSLASKKNNKGTLCSDCGDHYSCCCVAAVIYRRALNSPPSHPLPTEPQEDQESFPLYCHCWETSDKPKSDESNDGQPFQKLGKRKRNTANLVSGDLSTHWDPLVLKRIQIRYVATARDLLEHLLLILGKPVSEQPSRAIILDDIDLICDGLTYPSTTAKSRTSAILQTLAVAVDTTHALQRLHGVLPVVLATASSTTPNIGAPWIDTVVTLVPTNTESDATIESKERKNTGGVDQRSVVMNDPGVMVEQTWTANFQGGSAKCPPCRTPIDYSLVNHRPGVIGPRIEWVQN